MPTSPGRAPESTTTAILRTLSSWVPVTLPHLCAQSPATLYNHSATLVALAFMILSVTSAGEPVSAPIVSSTLSKTCSKSTIQFQAVRKIQIVRTALTGHSSRATAVTPRPARPQSPPAQLRRRAQRLARHPVGGAALTSPLPQHRRYPQQR